MKNLQLSPGEVTLLDYISDRVTERLLNIQRLKVTKRALEMARDIEVENLERYEKDVQQHIDANFPVVAKMQKYSALFMLFNDMHNWISRMITADPCDPHHVQDVQKTEQGWSVCISYDHFQTDLGVTREVAKSCLDQLIRRGVLEREKAMGGFRYRLTSLLLVTHRIREKLPAVWFSVNYDRQEDHFEPSPDYEQMTAKAREKYDFQKFFEEQVSLCLAKIEGVVAEQDKEVPLKNQVLG